MVIAGAGGHAREIIDVLKDKQPDAGLYLFEDTDGTANDLYGYHIIRSIDALKPLFKNDPAFVLGTGNPTLRRKLKDLLQAAGGVLTTVIAQSSLISAVNVQIGNGCNIMAFAFVSNAVTMGEGCLINARANLHHDVQIGDYSEISPGATLLGYASVGSFTVIGSGATILPKVKIGNNCVIGAGAVVTHDIADNAVAVGVPAKVIKMIPVH
jgi:sugar O-acyltransferase (sialic acid O-acetyltransferase NeuD family)